MFVVVQNQIREYLLRREKRRSLESANDPTRLSVLDRERRRVRETQQKMYEEHVQKTKKKKIVQGQGPNCKTWPNTLTENPH